MADTALDKVLEAYRDMFGVRSELANELHMDACVEVTQLREIKEAAWKLAQYPDSEAKLQSLLRLLGVE